MDKKLVSVKMDPTLEREARRAAAWLDINRSEFIRVAVKGLLSELGRITRESDVLTPQVLEGCRDESNNPDPER